jgi:hypothetical protein
MGCASRSAPLVSSSNSTHALTFSRKLGKATTVASLHSPKDLRDAALETAELACSGMVSRTWCVLSRRRRLPGATTAAARDSHVIRSQEFFMARRPDRSDIIDLVQEAVALGTPISVMLRHGRQFVDHARDVIRGAEEDWVVFESEGRVAVTDIAECVRANAVAHRLAGKTGST